MKINGGSIMGTITKSAGHPFDFLNLAVDCLAQGVGNAMTCVGNDIVYMGLNRLSRFLNGLKSRMCRPKIPALEILSHMGLIPIIPQMPKVLFYSPRPAYLQVFGSQCLKLTTSPRWNILLAPQPQISGSLQSLLPALRKFTMFTLSDLIYRSQNMLHHMKTIKNDLLLRTRYISLCSRNIRVPHVHCHGFNVRQFFLGKLPVIAFKTFLATILPYKLNSPCIKIVNQRFIFMSLRYGLLIHPDAAWYTMHLASATTINRSLQSIPSFVPSQSTKPGRTLDAALLSNTNDQTLKGMSHIRAVFTNLRFYLLNSMSRTVYSRWPNMNVGIHLAGVQMAIHALRRVIVHPVKLTTFRTLETYVFLMIHITVDSLIRFVHHYLFHKPRQLDSQYLCIKHFFVHAHRILKPLYVV